MRKMQQDELKRLEWLDQRANHSHGLKNMHRAGRSRSKTRSGSKGRPFVDEGDYQQWTNTRSRMAVQWDDELHLLEGEKQAFKNPEKLPREPVSWCCGNSPGK